MTSKARIVDLFTPSRDAVAVQPGRDYPNIGILNRGRGLFAKEPLNSSNSKAPTLYRVHTGQLVYSKLFGWEGSVAVVTPEFDACFVSSEFPAFTKHSDELDTSYLRHAVASSSFVEQMSRGTSGLGERRQRVNPDKFLQIEIPLPPLAEQQRIAAYLDEVAETATRILTESDGRRDSVSAVLSPAVQGERTPIHRLVRRQHRPVKVHEESRYDLAGVRWYGGGVFKRETKLGGSIAAKTLYEVKPGDFVYNRLFAWKESFALAEQPLWASNEFPTYTVDEDRILPEVFLALTLSPDFTAQVNEASTGSTPTSRNRLKEADFERLEVSVPRWDEQHAFRQRIRAARNVQSLDTRSRTLATALLPAARNEVFTALT
ncbi:restriction endonuclease subunit S [Dermacoccus abyssi]